MEIHGPSVGIGAGITAVIIVSAFFAFGPSGSESELQPVHVKEQNTLQMSVLVENGSPVLGDPGAKVTLVEFGDYQCFFCNKFFHDTEADIIENYVNTGKVKVVFKDYTIIGQDSVNAAHGAHCAGEQGLFWQYHDALYENWDGENTGWAAPENLLVFASNVGADTEIWNNCMLEDRYRDVIVSSNTDAKTLELTGTPAFFVIGSDGNVVKIGGAQPYSVFEQIFEAELAK